jgi:hypothetical protein
MPYAVKKGHLYVARSGSAHSYTTDPENARTFDTIEEAKADCCGNETVVWMSVVDVRPVWTPPKESLDD